MPALSVGSRLRSRATSAGPAWIIEHPFVDQPLLRGQSQPRNLVFEGPPGTNRYCGGNPSPAIWSPEGGAGSKGERQSQRSLAPNPRDLALPVTPVGLASQPSSRDGRKRVGSVDGWGPSQGPCLITAILPAAHVRVVSRMPPGIMGALLTLGSGRSLLPTLTTTYNRPDQGIVGGWRGTSQRYFGT